MRIIALFILLTITSCASLTDKAQLLNVVRDKDKVENCRAVGKVFASSSGSGDAGMMLLGKRNAEVKMKNIAAEMGDTLLITKKESDLFGSDHEGVVFICGPLAYTFSLKI